GTDDALYESSVVLLLTEGAVGTQGVLVRVTQQGEGQPFLVPELGELVRGVGRDAEDGEPGGVEVTQVVTEVAGLCGAPRGHGRRVEIQHDPFAGVGEHLAEVHLVAVGICQGEVGCPVAGLQTNRFAHVVVSSGRGRSRPDRHDPHTNESEGVPGRGWGADVPSAGKTCGTGPGCDCSSVPSHWGRTVTRSPIVDRTRIFGRPISGP